MTHKDIFGNDLNVGDTVAMTEPGYKYTLIEGVIFKSTEKQMWIKYNDGTKRTHKFPNQVVKKI